MLYVFKLKLVIKNENVQVYFDFKDTKAIAMTIKNAPILENTVIGSLKTAIDKIIAITISDKSKIVDVEAERCLSPSSHK